MKKKVLILGMTVVMGVGALFTGCGSKEKEVKEQKDILDYVDEDQVAGNNILIEEQLKSEFDVPEDMAAEKSAELMDMLFWECNVTVLVGSQPLDGNKLLLEDEVGTIWQVDCKGTGKDLTFEKVREMGSEVQTGPVSIEPDVELEPVEEPVTDGTENDGDAAVSATEVE